MRKLINNIPQDVREINGIKFDHEKNEYLVHHPCGIFINIPSNSKVFSESENCYDIIMGNIILSLPRYLQGRPHITVLKFEE